MDNIISDEYSLYWETNMFLRDEELNNNWGFDDALSVHSDSSSPDGSGACSASSSPTSKNIVSERNRRKKLNERLFALRATVPNISKMNKASIIKDAINYIQQLQKEEKRIQAEISDLEYSKSDNGIKDEGHNVRPNKKKTASSYVDSPVEDIECNISYMGDTTMAVSLMCSKRRDTMVKLCEVFESLGLKVITANITSSSSGTLFKTLLLQVDSEEKDAVKAKIEAAIATLSDPHI